MSETKPESHSSNNKTSLASLEAENKLLHKKCEELLQQGESVAMANAHAAELMVELEEVNNDLKIEIERRKLAEEKLQHAHDELETKVKERTAELAVTVEMLTVTNRQLNELAMIVEQTNEGVATANLEGKLGFVNTAWAKMHGYDSRDELIGKNLSIFHTGEQMKTEVIPFNNKIKLTGSGNSEIGHMRKDGTTFPTEMSVTLLKNESGNPIGLIGLISDISLRKKAEQAIKDLNKDLESTVQNLTIANRELKEFAYIVAHDLKSPVRAIGSLAGMISIECRDVLNEQCKEELDMLVQRTERMYALIDGILKYATLGYVAKQNENVDINEVINWVISQVETQKEAIEITMSKDLPFIMGQRAHITQIFQNLIDNAVKFMDKSKGQIRINCAEKDDFWEFSVSDNGPGIDEKYFDKIFQIFQTLTRRDEIEAAGIGLSLVRKIVELYGGKIWLTSKIGEGSTFFFTLPKQKTGVKNEESYADIISRR